LFAVFLTAFLSAAAVIISFIHHYKTVSVHKQCALQ
jgi:hypothetical protein